MKNHTRQSRRYAENPRDMAVFLRVAALGVIFSNKQKTRFQIWSRGVNACTEFQVCILFRLARRSRTNLQTH